MTDFNDTRSLLSHLETRRSGKPKEMVEPGPDAAQIARIVALASRTPDHGKLAPWRVVHIAKHRREAFATALRAAYLADKPSSGRLELEAMDLFATQAPELLAVLYSPREGKIPFWEQELSAGAFIMNLLHATHALGFVGSWITGWPAFNDTVRDLFGAAPERLAGFVYLGTPGRLLEERPRPDQNALLTHW